ncbi:hypothetical protein FB451DRAFT_1189009 [Mycena latifolia]|nr:hypothetical protein FB451DRAFT_1189009 [Mycena latifolia]
MSLKYLWGTDMEGPITGLCDICLSTVWAQIWRVPSRGSATFVCPLFGNHPEMRAQIWRVPSRGSATFVCPLFVNHPEMRLILVGWATVDRQLLFFQDLTLDMLSLKYFWGPDVEGPIKGLSDFCLSAVWQPSRNEAHMARWADLWISHTVRHLSNIFWATGTEGPIVELSDICLVKKNGETNAAYAKQSLFCFEFEYLDLVKELKKLDSLARRCGLQLLELHEEDTDTTKREEVKATWCLGPMDCKKAMCSTN